MSDLDPYSEPQPLLRARCECGLVGWEDECVPDCPRSGPGAGRPDFEITVRANFDPEVGMVAVGNDGITAAGPSDFIHVRRWLLGMVRGAAGQLPGGWDVSIRVNAALEDPTPTGRPDRPPVRLVPPPIDRIAAVEEAICGSEGCGMLLRRDSPESVWYHVPACTDPDPVSAPDRRPQAP